MDIIDINKFYVFCSSCKHISDYRCSLFGVKVFHDTICCHFEYNSKSEQLSDKHKSFLKQLKPGVIYTKTEREAGTNYLKPAWVMVEMRHLRQFGLPFMKKKHWKNGNLKYSLSYDQYGRLEEMKTFDEEGHLAHAETYHEDFPVWYDINFREKKPIWASIQHRESHSNYTYRYNDGAIEEKVNSDLNGNGVNDIPATGFDFRSVLKKFDEELSALPADSHIDYYDPPEFIDGKPVCRHGHTDNIIPICWGYPMQGTMDASMRGEVFIGGCIVGPEEYYCKTHKIKF